MSTLFPGAGVLIRTQIPYDTSCTSKETELYGNYVSDKETDAQWWSSFINDAEFMDDKYATMCPECNTGNFVEIEEDEAICKRCAISLGFQIDQSAEYRWFGSDDKNPDPTRVGNPQNPLLPESSMGTRILVRPGESKAMRKIRQYHLWNVMPYRERSLWNVFEMLQVRAANAGISAAILDETKQLYAQVSPLCICRGQQKEALMAACLFESLKRHDTPRRPAEIAEIFKINLKHITRGVKQFSGLLDEHLHAQAKKEQPKTEAKNTMVLAPIATPSTNFRHYLEPAILRLETPRSFLPTLQALSIRLGELLDELGVCPETTPPSMAACSIALSCQKMGLEKNTTEIAAVCGISNATLQKCLKRIEKWKPMLFKNIG